MIQNKIIPHLWFDRQAKEVVEFYVSTFGSSPVESMVDNISTLKDTPSGDTDIVSFTLWGQNFMAISAGPLFKFNPSISFMVNFDSSLDSKAADNLDRIWSELAQGGEIRMPIDKYPFSQRYGWVQDKYGLNWQLILTDPKGEKRPQIVPTLLFVDFKQGQAEAARSFYLSVFKESQPGTLVHYGKDHGADKEGTVMFSDFRLLNSWFVAMDGGVGHNFTFNEAISFMVVCNNQAEIDYYWEKLSAVPESEQCGWLKDKFGVSWQVVPRGMQKLMESDDQQKVARVTQAFLNMKKINLAELEQAAT